MKAKRKLKDLPSLMIVSACVLVSACSTDNVPTASNVPDMTQSPECQQNVFLQKYNCSLDQVEQAAEQGEPDAEYALGYMYYYGIMAEQDQETAVLWIKRAAEQGQPLAIKALGMMEKKNFGGEGQSSKKDKVISTDSSDSDRDSDIQPVGAPVVPHHVKKTSSVSESEHLPTSNALLLRVPPSHYTIQLMGSENEKMIQDFVEKNHLSKSTHTYKTALHGKPFYVLIYGNYKSINDAKSAEAKLPKALQVNEPWVKSFKAVQEQLK